MPTVAVDAMGGEFAPEAAVKAVAEISLTTGIECVLVGDAARLQKILEGFRYNPEWVRIEHAEESIGADEDPRRAVRAKRRSSLVVAVKLAGAGEADAVVGAVASGAALLACARHLPLIDGVRRPAAAAVYSRNPEYPGQDPLALLLDVGATLHGDADDLVQFGLMGSAYASRISRRPAPRIALLNVGPGADAGGEVLAEAHRRLAAVADVNFVGNIEGHELLGGKADVIVAGGFAGRVVAGLVEGLADVAGGVASAAAQQNWRWRLGLAMLSQGFERLRNLTDYASYGGAPILGFERIFLQVHPRSTAAAIANAVKVAAKAVREGVGEEIQSALARSV